MRTIDYLPCIIIVPARVFLTVEMLNAVFYFEFLKFMYIQDVSFTEACFVPMPFLLLYVPQ